MSLIKLFLGGNNLVFSRPERVWSVTSRLGTGKWLTLFYSVQRVLAALCGPVPCAVRTLLLCSSTHKTGHCAPLYPPTHHSFAALFTSYIMLPPAKKSAKSASLGKTALVKDRVNKASFGSFMLR
jgi:hypothetical protein